MIDTLFSRRELFAVRPAFAPPLSGREMMRKRYFSDVPLVSHEGKRIRFYSDLLKGRIVVLHLMCADCTASCPLITANLARVQKILGRDDVFFYSLTIKPLQDTPQKLHDYAEMHRIKRNWLFLTGQPDDLELLRVRLGWSDPNPEKDRKDKALHSGMCRYGNEPPPPWCSVQLSADPDRIGTADGVAIH